MHKEIRRLASGIGLGIAKLFGLLCVFTTTAAYAQTLPGAEELRNGIGLAYASSMISINPCLDDPTVNADADSRQLVISARRDLLPDFCLNDELVAELATRNFLRASLLARSSEPLGLYYESVEFDKALKECSDLVCSSQQLQREIEFMLSTWKSLPSEEKQDRPAFLVDHLVSVAHPHARKEIIGTFRSFIGVYCSDAPVVAIRGRLTSDGPLTVGVKCETGGREFPLALAERRETRYAPIFEAERGSNCFLLDKRAPHSDLYCSSYVNASERVIDIYRYETLDYKLVLTLDVQQSDHGSVAVRSIAHP